ncbi:DUF979 domain-containing protein [Phenylobacterium montanum]|uniref:DUF979 domain-containing protein n=1 Tax=Phenylobacterium montanum TaxID=2823693 RepID=A0A975FYN3_9CAUL|nr:DUF979 domain-containing protein [Caulobacter sp. S6]QUD87399.1 DUF979 domain-containing protein [Caulobacter sp. S6]
MIRLEQVYVLAGLMMAAVAVLSAADKANPRRWAAGAFWGLFATSFLFGSRLTDFANGLLALAMVVVAGVVGLGRGAPATTSPEQRATSAARLGERVFLPALVIPAVTLLGALVLKNATLAGQPLIEAKQATLVSLGIGALAAVALAMALTRPPLVAPLQESRRLLDHIGWAAVLPQLLAALGAVFALSGVGQAVSSLIGHLIPLDNRLLVICAYTFGMAAFTMVMGNAFAAFPVMTAGIGLPLIVRRFGGDPATMAAIGMLSGFCGTLMTPMAANFNIVPAALLELQDRYAVIKAQVPTALALLVINTALMALLVFHPR